MVGYIVDERIGAIIYNIGHSFILPAVLLTIALLANMAFLLPIAMIWLAHIFMDRALGYGLKYTTGFKETHIQKIV